jgi:hypothetical protein
VRCTKISMTKFKKEERKIEELNIKGKENIF